MPILSAYIVPHPPLIIPSVGRGTESQISATINSFNVIASEIAAKKPDTIIVISPHSATYSDYIHISPDVSARGSFVAFNAPEEKLEVFYDVELTGVISGLAEEKEIRAGKLGEKNKPLDHGTMVPLYFINQHFKDYRLVRISIAGISFEEHYRLGICIQKAVELTKRNVVIIASGDLSHKLKEDGPYGFTEEGPEFDQKVTDIIKGGYLSDFLEFDSQLCEAAAECGLRAFIIMAGALDNIQIKSEILSYEGPFGVGYAVGSFTPDDAYINLARLTLEHYIRTQKLIECPHYLPYEMYQNKAGIFVSLKIDGQLRGCIGTIEPVQDNIALEVMVNAISAGTKDPRFPPISEEELEKLVYSVDILKPAESVSNLEKLDVKRYGIIVHSGLKRGLLLPNLEGVDSVSMQIEIALSKAGIESDEKFMLERFEVVRHK